MGIPLSRVLQVFQRVYQTSGNRQVPSLVDIDTPVTPVHDLSREAELGSGYGRFNGFATLSTNVVHGPGVTDEFAAQTPYATLLEAATQISRRPRSQSWVWLMSCQVLAADPANLVGAWISAEMGPSLPELSTETHFLVWASGNRTQLDLPVQLGGFIPSVNNAPTNFEMQGVGPVNRLPILLPEEGSVIQLASQASAVATITFDCLYWLGPRGVTPPGVR